MAILKIPFSIKLMLFFVIGIMAACTDNKNTTSIVPEIGIKGEYLFNSGYGYDSFVLIDIEFKDGDGDIGLSASDTFGDFAYGKSNFYNLKCWFWAKKQGRWVKVMNPLIPNDTLNLHERIDNLTPKGEQKGISGLFNFRISARPFSYRADTVKYQFQLVDRALHSSNIVETKIFILKHP